MAGTSFNQVTLVGRLTKDPELSTTNNNKQKCKYTLAVERKPYDGNKEPGADFIQCVAFDKMASVAAQYLKKGSLVLVTGSWRVDTYKDNNGNTQYYHSCTVREQNFLPSGNNQNNNGNSGGGYQQQGYNNGYNNQYAGGQNYNNNNSQYNNQSQNNQYQQPNNGQQFNQPQNAQYNNNQNNTQSNGNDDFFNDFNGYY